MKSNENVNYEARMERLRWLAEKMKKKENSVYEGADYEFGFHFLFGEVIEMQKHFIDLFGEDMTKDKRLSGFYNRMTQMLESSEVVLIDSVDVNASKESVGALFEKNRELEKSIAASKKETDRLEETRKKRELEAAEREAKKNNRRKTYPHQECYVSKTIKILKYAKKCGSQ